MSVTRAIRYRVRHWLGSNLASVVLLTLLITVVGAGMIATAAGARRTQTAPDRYQAAFGGGHDFEVVQQSGDPATDQVAALPSVERVDAVTFMFFAGTTGGADQFVDANPFAGSVHTFDSRIVEGREPDPTTVHEFAATPSVLAQAGISIGDTLHFVSQSPESGDRNGFNPNFLDGPEWDAELVGVIETASELDGDGSAMIVLPAARVDGSIHIEATVMSIDLVAGASEQQLRAELDAALPDLDFTIEISQTVDETARTAVRGQAIGLWLLAALGAIAAIAAIGHLLGRTVRVTDDERRSLSALGTSHHQLVGESVGRAAVVIVGGVVLGSIAAVLASGLFPFGFTRDVEPSPGIRLEPAVVTSAATTFAVAMLAWVAISAWLAIGDRRPAASSHARISGVVAARSPSPTMATGVRFAYARRGGRAAPMFTVVGGTVLSVTALVGTLTFGLSLQRLTDEPMRWGENFDVAFDNGADGIQAEVLQYATDNAMASDIELYRASQGRVGDIFVPIISSESLRGEIEPVVLDGRAPYGDDEIAIGPLIARDLRAEIGDRISIANRQTVVELEVVGVAAVPGMGGYDVLGRNSYIDTAAYDALFGESPPETLALRFLPGADLARERRAIARLLGQSEDDLGLARPSAIVNLQRVTFVPFALSGLLLGLAAVALVGTLWSGVRRREQQAAVLRALGADRGWLRRAVVWQALAFTVAPALVGAAAGLIAGRLVYRNFAHDTGVVESAAIPWSLGSGALAVLIVAGVAAALGAGHRVRVVQPATLLRTG